MHAAAWLEWFWADWHPLVVLGAVVTVFAWIGLARRGAPISRYVRALMFAPILVLGGPRGPILVLSAHSRNSVSRRPSSSAHRT